jgi:Domain of unknown function (DUF4326)
MTPKRIQLSRRKGWRKPVGAIVVSRPSKWGNPYALDSYQFGNLDGSLAAWNERAAREIALRDFEHALCMGMLKVTVEDVRRELAGKDLACWCPLNKLCHADVLIRLANEDAMTKPRAYIRKRDGVLVTVQRRGSKKVLYVTHPMLVLWETTPTSFARCFREATEAEAADLNEERP